MPSRRVRWIVGLLLVALLGGGAGWHWLRPGARREKVGLLVTASLRASLTARTKGDVQFGGVALLSSALHELRRRYGEDAVAYLDAGNALFGDIGQFEFAQQMPGVLRGWNCAA